MKGTQEKERLRLRDDGNYEFSTAEKKLDSSNPERTGD